MFHYDCLNCYFYLHSFIYIRSYLENHNFKVMVVLNLWKHKLKKNNDNIHWILKHTTKATLMWPLKFVMLGFLICQEHAKISLWNIAIPQYGHMTITWNCFGSVSKVIQCSYTSTNFDTFIFTSFQTHNFTIT